jgi:hypothetical protein
MPSWGSQIQATPVMVDNALTATTPLANDMARGIPRDRLEFWRCDRGIAC